MQLSFSFLTVIVAILAVPTSATRPDSRCDARWTLMGDFCYSFYFNAQSFSAAQSRCEDMGSTIASVHSAEVNQYFVDVMLRNRVSRLWIGFNDIYEEGSFQWLDGSPIVYTNWAISDHDGTMIPEPNNGGAGPGRGEDCTEIWLLWGHNGTWNDAPCGFKMAFVCQSDAVPLRPETVDPVEPSLQCPHSSETIVELGTPSKAVFWVEPSEYTPNIQRTNKPGDEFLVGLTVVTYTVYENGNIIATCDFSVIVLEVDTTPPTIKICPKDIGKPISNTDKNTVSVYWDEPSATDLSGVTLTSQSHFSGDEFEAGEHNITYIFTDGSGNKINCNFNAFIVAGQDETVQSIPSSVPATVIAIILGFFLLIVLIIIAAVYIRNKNKAWYASQRLVNENDEEELM